MNFKSFGNDSLGGGGGGGEQSEITFPLTSQSSIYALTFDELQNTIGGAAGKDFGSMNMDELLKSIWNAEETQTIGSTSGAPNGNLLQRQASLTLPRTLSVKTVDQVWKDISKEFGGAEVKDSTSFAGERQQTLGEITLEEFLVKAGVVMEDTQFSSKPNHNNTGLFSNALNSGTNPGYGTGFQQPSRNQIDFQSGNLPLNVNRVGSSQQQQQHQIFPKPAGQLGYAGGQLGSPGIRVQTLNGNLVNNMGLQGGGVGGVTVAIGSPAVSSDGIGKSNGDTSSVSPVPYVFNGGLRGRKNSAVEKVIERRQKRMIKNRESAARSRARKQAYTMELEAEVAKLKEENQELRKRQAEIMEMQKNQVMEMMNLQRGAKRQCLRRTQTGPW
jgi:ABA responsive element binding factor